MKESIRPSTSVQEREFWSREVHLWRDHQDLFGGIAPELFLDLHTIAEPYRTSVPEGGIILNIGSGANNDRFPGCAPGARLIAVDFSLEMLRANRSESKVQADVTHTLPFADGSVDLCASAFVMRYLTVDSHALLLADMRRVLRPGGAFVIVDLAKNGYPFQKSEFRADAFARIAEQAGFMDVRHDTVSRTRTKTIWGGWGATETLSYELGFVGGVNP